MTDRINGLVVTLDRDYRDDDVEQIVAAIAQLRGVISVTKNVAQLEDVFARERVKRELQEKLLAVLRPVN